MTKQLQRLILQWKSTSTIVNKNSHFRQGRSKHKTFFPLLFDGKLLLH